VPANKLALLKAYTLASVNALVATVNMFPVMVIHLLLNPTSGKSSQLTPVASALILNSYHEPVGFPVSEIAIRKDEVSLSP